MKMPEPVGVVSETWAHWPEKGEAACVDWLNDKSPPVGTKLYDKQALIDLLEESAALVAPKRQRPCDCEVCDCGNRDDAQRVAEWDADNTAAQEILKLKETL
jgi:hypothetical protein